MLLRISSEKLHTPFRRGLTAAPIDAQYQMRSVQR